MSSLTGNIGCRDVEERSNEDIVIEDLEATSNDLVSFLLLTCEFTRWDHPMRG